MNYDAIIDRLFKTRQVCDDNGNYTRLTSEVSLDEGDLLRRLIDSYNLRTTLEIGCAYGISSLFICDALSRRTSPNHTIIDPFQSTNWRNVGIRHLREAQCNFFTLIEEFSEYAMPRLLAQNTKYDLILIDGLHTFDQALLEFYYADRMLVDGGFLVFDDVHLPGIRMACRYFLTCGNYQVVDTAKQHILPQSWKRRTASRIVKAFFAALPDRVCQDIVSPTFYTPDQALGLTSPMIALRKTHAFARPDHWFIPF